MVPGLGPFLTLATRKDACDENQDGTASDTGDCLSDLFVGMMLIADGLMQTAGGVVLAVGLTAKKKVLVQETRGATLRVTPMRVGGGRGLGVVGSF